MPPSNSEQFVTYQSALGLILRGFDAVRKVLVHLLFDSFPEPLVKCLICRKLLDVGWGI